MGFACGGPTPTFREEAAGSDFVIFGKLEPAEDGDDPESTRYRITHRLKDHACIQGGEVVHIPRILPVPQAENTKGLLLFGIASKDKPDFIRGVEGTRALRDYVLTVMSFDARDRGQLLRFTFDYLNHEEKALARDAFDEFAQDTEKDVWSVAKTFTPGKLRGWLRDERTPVSRLGLYAHLLSASGTPEDSLLIHNTIHRLVVSDNGMNIDRLLIAYAILTPKEGWKYTRELIVNPASEFHKRYDGLKVIRYFKEHHSGVIAEKELIAAISDLVAQHDFADLPINNLRKWKCWELNDQIFSLTDKKEFQKKFIRRDLLRYALQCPDARAAKYVAEQRKTDPDWVANNEKWLDEEAKENNTAKP
jgi:hypothetical protein